MGERDFKKHLAALAHGHHHPEEHDWEPEPAALAEHQPAKKRAPKRKPVKKAARSARRS